MFTIGAPKNQYHERIFIGQGTFECLLRDLKCQTMHDLSDRYHLPLSAGHGTGRNFMSEITKYCNNKNDCTTHNTLRCIVEIHTAL